MLSLLQNRAPCVLARPLVQERSHPLHTTNCHFGNNGDSNYIASANHRKFSSALKIKFSTKLLSHQNKMTMLGLPSRWLTVYFKITTLTKCNSNLYASFGIISSYNHNC